MPATRFRLNGLAMVLLAAAAVLVVIAIGWFATGHVKHGLAFLGVAVLCLVGAWFTSNPSGTKS
jgi:hypothetical protein